MIHEMTWLDLTIHVRRSAMIVATAGLALVGPRADGQLAPKTTLGATGPSGCAAYAAPSASGAAAAADDPEARRLIADGQEAALQGEHATARDAFVKAAQRAPTNARVAYYLGREHEALEESTAAVREYCRYLLLLPAAPDGDEVRGRIVRLVPTSELARVDEARANFRSGVALLQRRQFNAADSVFGAILRLLPNAAEGYYNRGLARAARGQRSVAIEDFEKYLELAPSAADRLQLRGIMTRLPDRVYRPTSALASGVVPGLGQMNTGRPVLGLAVLGAVGGAFAFGMTQKETIEVRQFTDPFGNPYVDSLPKKERPNFVVAASVAGLMWIGSAFESMSYARRSRARAEAIVRTARNETESDSRGIALSPFIGSSMRRSLLVGMSLRVTP